MALVLASTSPARRALLSAAGVRFEAVSPGVDEAAAPDLRPRSLARWLALAKARTVAARRPGDTVVGADQTIEIDGRLLRKPRSRAEARRQLSALCGRRHRLHSAVAVCRARDPFEQAFVESVTLDFRHVPPRELERYLDTREWEGCAGGYRIEGRGIRLVESLRGDYHAVIGLPLVRLFRTLREAGVALD